ncbi:hypothetical protein CK203_066857 [Vitis vinifera]|uniref:Uncharacterized protein n=1 Tax=Vitis vinifera TaxID=29760 RepID=A0A438EUX5_VITVI|nr:hypothetical protein CK203_066857 [Vitis vinifera]
MARHSAPRFSLRKKFLFALVFFFSVPTVVFLIKRAPSISCDRHSDAGVKRFEPLPQFGARSKPTLFHEVEASSSGFARALSFRANCVSQLMSVLSYVANSTEIFKKNTFREGLLTAIQVTSKDNRLLD